MRRLFWTALAATALLAGPALAQDDHAGHDHDGHDHSVPEPKGEAPSHVFTVAPDDRVVGGVDAPNTLIVYASNTCPHCRSWFTEEWPALKKSHVDTGKLRVVYRPIPTEPVQLSMIGFMIAECAPEGEYMDNILHQYARQEAIFELAQTGGLRAEYAAIGAKAGLADEAAMNACLADEDNLASLHLAGRRANHARVGGIPSSGSGCQKCSVCAQSSSVCIGPGLTS